MVVSKGHAGGARAQPKGLGMIGISSCCYACNYVSVVRPKRVEQVDMVGIVDPWSIAAGPVEAEEVGPRLIRAVTIGDGDGPCLIDW